MSVKPSVTFRTNKKIRKTALLKFIRLVQEFRKGGGERATFEGGPFFHPTSGSEICRSIFAKPVRCPVSLISK